MKKNTIVIKYGGNVIENTIVRKKIIKEILNISKKNNILIVHGGGKQITNALKKSGIRSRFINGLRYTDKKMIKILEEALCKVNKSISNRKKCAVGISCKDGNTIIAERIKKLGYVGKVKKVNTELIRDIFSKNIIPVVSPVSSDGKGTTLNLNADTVAVELACALKSNMLIFLTDVSGIYNKDNRILHKIKLNQINKLISCGIVTAGMIPKLKGCLAALKKGIKKIYITDGTGGLISTNGTFIRT